LGAFVTGIRQAAVFGRRKEPHTVIIARGDDIRHFTIRPWLAAFAGSVLAALVIGYLLATTYLVLRDDLVGATVVRQARMQQAYEDRISALRAQVDRITSRQLLDQQIVESKVSELLARQSQLTLRHGRLGPILDRMSGDGAGPALPVSGVPVPQEKPDVRALLDSPGEAGGGALAALWPMRQGRDEHESAADRADKLFVAINRSLRAIEEEQIEGLDALAENAFQTADTIAEALAAAGLDVAPAGEAESAVGGPLVPLEAGRAFEMRVRELDEALEKLETVKAAARALPIHNPAPGQAVTSSFGVRRDPLLRTPALHAGIDFRAPIGTPVKVTGAGTVVRAGWNGGYGRMVEVDHGHGLTTRYAHLSKIRVRHGQRLDRGDFVGEAGSSGRSTGPHLHYEVRRNGDAVDPLRFLKVGKTIADLL
jgi:murein DD-endopeptidase MepM/ murein hydrolase activator NlpD